MPRQKSPIVCSRCNSAGGTISSKPVAPFVQLPRRENIIKIDQSSGSEVMKLSDSFDYVAKISLRLERDLILLPQITENDDFNLARGIYEEMKGFDPHTEKERKLFEKRWFKEHNLERKLIREEKNAVEKDLKQFEDAKSKYLKSRSYMDDLPAKRIRAPMSDNMHISRASIAWHYAAILFTALSNLASRGVMPPSETSYSLATYHVFDYFKCHVDGRYRRTPLQWAKILDTRIEHGYNAASSMSALPINACRQCYDLKGEITDMRSRKKHDGSIEWFCLECGGTESLVREITAKNIKKREGRIALEHNLYLKSIPVYLQLKENFSVVLEQDEGFRVDLKTNFERQENESRKLSFHIPFAYSIQHYDPSKKGKKRYCSHNTESLLRCRVTDAIYSQNIQLLAYMIRKCPDVVTSKHKTNIDRCTERLANIGFPKECVFAKFETDLKQVLFSVLLDGWICQIVSR